MDRAVEMVVGLLRPEVRARRVLGPSLSLTGSRAPGLATLGPVAGMSEMRTFPTRRPVGRGGRIGPILLMATADGVRALQTGYDPQEMGKHPRGSVEMIILTGGIAHEHQTGLAMTRHLVGIVRPICSLRT